MVGSSATPCEKRDTLLRWGDAPWRGERFDIARGRTGGEDTEFFERLRAMGARFARADRAVAREPVPPGRLTLRWLWRRRHRVGQTHGELAGPGAARAWRFVPAAAKSGYCFLRAVPALPRASRRNFWLLRGVMHAGVCAGCLSLPQRKMYGS